MVPINTQALHISGQARFVNTRLKVSMAVEQHVSIPPPLLPPEGHPLQHVAEHLRHVLIIVHPHFQSANL